MATSALISTTLAASALLGGAFRTKTKPRAVSRALPSRPLDSDYYYALGPHSALTEEQRKLRVGGKDMVHIFHLPNGTSAFDVSEGGEQAPPKRKSVALSELSRLTSGAQLRSFPEYPLPPDYQDPLGSSALAAEQQAMALLTEALYTSELEELTKEESARLQVASRNTDQKDATLSVVDFLQYEFKSTGANVCVQFFQRSSWGSTRDIYNVIGFVEGTEAGSVTIGAHFDDLPSRGIAPGAEDDGSGTAAVVSALKAVAGAGIRPKKSMYFVAFGGEEQGLIGSKRFADELRYPGSTNSPIPEPCRVAATSDHTAFTMDMIGFRNPDFDVDTVTIETYDWSAALLNPLAMSNQVNNGGALKLLYSDYPFGSDHMSFLRNNFPCTLAIDNDADVYKYPCYHRSCDSMEYINTRFARDIAKMNLGAALRIAGIN